MKHGILVALVVVAVMLLQGCVSTAYKFNWSRYAEDHPFSPSAEGKIMIRVAAYSSSGIKKMKANIINAANESGRVITINGHHLNGVIKMTLECEDGCDIDEVADELNERFNRMKWPERSEGSGKPKITVVRGNVANNGSEE